jgi:dTDP-glucose 4,6-dehydratase
MIGRHLASRLRSSGYKVVALDTEILRQEGYLRADICSMVETMQAFKQWNIDFVFHLAGEVGRENGELFARRSIDVNVSGTMNILQLCREYDVPMIFASTSEIYGDLNEEVMSEDLFFTKRVFQTNCYAISKFQAETFLKHFVENYGTKAISLRFFMCYGEGEFPSYFRSAVSRFVYNILDGKPITVHKGTVRSWCHVDDITLGCQLAMEKADMGIPYKAYNIGRHDPKSMEEVAKLCCRLAGRSESLIRYSEVPKFVTPVKIASFDKARRELGYESHITLEEGLKRTIEWQREKVLPFYPDLEC